MRALRVSWHILCHSEGYPPTLPSCGSGGQQAAHGNTLGQTLGELPLCDKKYKGLLDVSRGGLVLFFALIVG